MSNDATYAPAEEPVTILRTLGSLTAADLGSQIHATDANGETHQGNLQTVKHIGGNDRPVRTLVNLRAGDWQDIEWFDAGTPCSVYLVGKGTP